MDREIAPPLALRPLRKDAVRNHTLILAAAQDVFARGGFDAPLDEIARTAGIGIGTLYRRFPGRQELVEAVLTAKAQEYLVAACEAIRDEDPWHGFSSYIERIFELQATDQTVSDLLTLAMPECPNIARLREQITEAQQAVITRAIEAGALRDDFVPADVIVLLLAHRGVTQASGNLAPDSWRRLLTFTLDALRVPPPTAR